MQPDTQIIVHNTYQNTVQRAKVKQSKKCITNFAISKQKKTETAQEKNVTPKQYAYKKILHGRSMLHVRKSAKTGTASPEQPGQRHLPTFLANYEFVTASQSKFCDFLK